MGGRRGVRLIDTDEVMEYIDMALNTNDIAVTNTQLSTFHLREFCATVLTAFFLDENARKEIEKIYDDSRMFKDVNIKSLDNMDETVFTYVDTLKTMLSARLKMDAINWVKAAYADCEMQEITRLFD